MTNFSREINIIKDLAYQAGDAVLEIYKREYEVVEKEDNQGPVTEADLIANKIILKGLKKYFPRDAVISEESPDNLVRLDNKRVWCVDPIDGTLEFIKKNDEFSIQIGLIQNKRPSFGVVYMPALKIMVYGGSSIGAFKECESTLEQLHIKPKTNMSDLIMVVSRSHPSKVLDALKEKIGFRNEISFGSIGGKVIMIVLGKADFFIHANPNTKEWDTCAPEAVLMGAGGHMSDLSGLILNYNKKNVFNLNGVVASGGWGHAHITQKVQDVLRDRKNNR
ncbi:3'(2'),5'-bisphosphate nucleotidase CysQ [PVC group bacterium]|nr:3'(2'),5'-bisphosphate nucleotidase CysQ [PVC group bacterium]